MKKQIIYAVALILVTGIVGCTDILDKQEPGSINPEDIWSSEESANLYINSLYGTFMDAGFGENSGISEETDGGSPYIYGEVTTDYVSLYSQSYYAGIRDINIAIEQARQGDMEQAAIERVLGQAHFLRAWEYWQLVKRYGGVPYIKQSVNPFAENLSFPRELTSHCINEIVADLDTARTYLPDAWPEDERGRVTRGAAAALKGRVLLYWASPQFNPDGDQQRWQRAYTANSEAKQLLDQDGYGLYPSFGRIFLDEGNQSFIFGELFSNATGEQIIHGWESSLRPPSVNGSGSVTPTWELVKAFPTVNGVPINDPDAAYDSTKFYNNRDPRFYETIAFNAANWTFSGYPDDRRQFQYYVDGSTVEPSGGTDTGFYARKASNPDIPTTEIGNTGTDWIEMRYAEVLLNLAEAANATDRRQVAYNQLIAVRDRAGINPGFDGLYGLDSNMNREEMVDAIMRERLIEFAFENKRYWDLRRRNLFEEQLNGTRRHGLRINFTGSDHEQFVSTMRDTMSTDQMYEDYFEGELVSVDQQQPINYPQPQYNFFAIPTNVLQRSPEIEQTQGWDGGTFDPLQ